MQVIRSRVVEPLSLRVSNLHEKIVGDVPRGERHCSCTLTKERYTNVWTLTREGGDILDASLLFALDTVYRHGVWSELNDGRERLFHKITSIKYLTDDKYKDNRSIFITIIGDTISVLVKYFDKNEANPYTKEFFDELLAQRPDYRILYNSVGK